MSNGATGDVVPIPTRLLVASTNKVLVSTVTLPDTVSELKVPTEVKLDAVTPEANVAPVNVPAAAVTVMSAEPLNDVPLMLRAVCNVVAVVALPDKAAVTVPAEKLPEASRATMVDPVLALVALLVTVNVAAPDPL